uniref:Uncharacterized protein n=1 Tax=Janibacter limosus TaxID=53458 RepID=A0AC61U1A9_9MICO|nr:hypothetical protein [Janibacter limosus]
MPDSPLILPPLLIAVLLLISGAAKVRHPRGDAQRLQPAAPARTAHRQPRPAGPAVGRDRPGPRPAGGPGPLRRGGRGRGAGALRLLPRGDRAGSGLRLPGHLQLLRSAGTGRGHPTHGRAQCPARRPGAARRLVGHRTGLRRRAARDGTGRDPAVAGARGADGRRGRRDLRRDEGRAPRVPHRHRRRCRGRDRGLRPPAPALRRARGRDRPVPAAALPGEQRRDDARLRLPRLRAVRDADRADPRVGRAARPGGGASRRVATARDDAGRGAAPAERILHDPQATPARIFGIGTPGAVLLGGDGLLAGGPVQGSTEVLAFVDDVHAELVEAGVVEAGEISPGQ